MLQGFVPPFDPLYFFPSLFSLALSFPFSLQPTQPPSFFITSHFYPYAHTLAPHPAIFPPLSSFVVLDIIKKTSKEEKKRRWRPCLKISICTCGVLSTWCWVFVTPTLAEGPQTQTRKDDIQLRLHLCCTVVYRHSDLEGDTFQRTSFPRLVASPQIHTRSTMAPLLPPLSLSF